MQESALICRSTCGQAMVLGNFQRLSIQLIWIIVGQGPIVLAVDGGGNVRLYKEWFYFKGLKLLNI